MERRPLESPEAYKARRAANQAWFAAKLKPRLLWDSHNLGTYSRKAHGELKSA